MKPTDVPEHLHEHVAEAFQAGGAAELDQEDADAIAEAQVDINALATFEYNCQCAMDGDSGFCGTVQGTDIYKENITLVKNVLEKNECHTKDRYDQRAWKDSCGNTSTSEWEGAVESKFKLNHWPYINVERKRECIEQTFSDSLTNLKKNQGILSGIQLFTTFAVLFMTYL